jgi:hypothetical protein
MDLTLCLRDGLVPTKKNCWGHSPTLPRWPSHVACGHLVRVLTKKELLLAAMMMSQNKLNRLAAKREKLVVESAHNFDASIQLIANLTDNNNASDKTAVDATEDEVFRVVGDEVEV